MDPSSHRPVEEPNATVFDEMMATGAVITGRRTFEFAGRGAGDHHDGVPVFVLTHAAPGRRLFEDLPPEHVELELLRALRGPGVLHLRYHVRSAS